MTTYSGLQSTYSNTAAQKRMVTDRIILADPYDIAAITALGLKNENKFRFVNEPHRQYEWLEDAYPLLYDSCAGSNLTTATDTTTITVTTPALFHVGDIIQIDTEQMYVASISSSVLTVVRGFGGDTSVSHAETSVAYIRYSARLEGADSSDSPYTEFSTGYNYSTIFHKEVNVSRDERLFPNYGASDLLEYRIDKNMDILMEQLNRIPYYGKRASGSHTTARASGGLGTFVTTNATALSSAPLTRDFIDTEFRQIYAAGGMTDLILTDAWGQKKINDFYEGFVSTERSEKIGGMLIKQLLHPVSGKLASIVVDRHCPSGYMYMLDTRHVGYITIDPFFYEELAKTGDATNGEIIGEYGFVCAANKFHSILSGYSTSA